MKHLITLLCAIISMSAFSQTNTFPSGGSAGIGTTSPNASSIMEMVSTSQGILVPRMTLSQRNAISSPATGLLIYQSDSSPGFYFYNGTAWTVIYSGAALNQNLLPDADNSRSLGSTAYSWNNMYADGAFYLNSNRFLGQSTTYSNTYVGSNSGITNTVGELNTFIGYESGYYCTEGHNTGVGAMTLRANTTGYNNTAAGMQALTSTTTGYGNTALGSSTMYYNTTGNDNTATGKTALMSNTTGSENTASGINAMRNNTSGTSNTSTGGYALYSNTSGSYNTATGYKTLYTNTTGVRNVALGFTALYSNTTGNDNNAMGREALYYNTSGAENNAIGMRTLWKNTTGNGNTGIGDNALRENTTGYYNVGSGQGALLRNTTGYENTASGNDALAFNDNGYYNSAFGRNAMKFNTTGHHNAALGYGAGQVNDASNYCTFLGYDADQSSTSDYSNSTALGNGSRISASDQVRIGNSSVSSIGGYANWTNISDGRFKSGIKENVPGLAFIDLLRPVTYHLDVSGIHKFLKEGEEAGNNAAQKEKATFTGFIAQEVEVAAKKIGYDFSGVDVPGNDNSLYGLRYAEFTVPLVKAVQELNALNNELRNKNTELENRIEKLELMDNHINFSEKITQSVKLNPSAVAPRLDNNIPNPFTGKTIIGYYVPENIYAAQLKINAGNGTELITIDIKKGEGRIELDASLLAPGNYFYCLVVDGKVEKTKEFLIVK